MALKSALVLGMCEYDNEHLAQLHAPSSDVKALAEVLREKGRGEFERVTEHVDAGKFAVELAISELFAEREKEDLVLLYFSGHGLKDDGGELYLAVKDTNPKNLDGTAVSAHFIRRVMNKSASRRQVLILDCCHSGAFSKGFKGADVIGSNVGTEAAFNAEGYARVILTASDSTQYAWENEKFTGEAQTSLYTSFLIEGIRSGNADLSRDGLITVNELHDYVYKRTVESTPKQRPMKICDQEQGDLILSRAPLREAQLDEGVKSGIRSPFANVRQAMVGNLVRLFRNEPAGVAIAAYKALAAMTSDDSLSVQAAATKAMEDCRGARPEISPSLLSEIGLADNVVASPQIALEEQKKQAEDAVEAARKLAEDVERAKVRRLTEMAAAAKEEREALDARVKAAAEAKAQETVLEATQEEARAKAQARAKARAEAKARATLEAKAGEEAEAKQGAEQAQARQQEFMRVATADFMKTQEARPSILDIKPSGPLPPGKMKVEGLVPGAADAGTDKMPQKRWWSHWAAKLAIGCILLLMIRACAGMIIFGNSSKSPASSAPAVSGSTAIVDDTGGSANAIEQGGASGATVAALVFDPPSNIRALPTDASGIVCRITAAREITVLATPLRATNGLWWQTEACGKRGFIANNQVQMGGQKRE